MLPIAEVSPPQKLATLFTSQQTLVSYTEAGTQHVEKLFAALSYQGNIENTGNDSVFIPLDGKNCESVSALIDYVTDHATAEFPINYFFFSRFEYILDNFSLKDAVRCIEFLMTECKCKVVIAGNFKEIHASLFRKLAYLAHTAYSMQPVNQVCMLGADYVLKEYNLCCRIQKMRYTIINHDEKEPIEVVL